MAEVDLITAIAGMVLDTSDFEKKVVGVEQRVEHVTKDTATKFNMMAAGIAAGMAITVLAAMKDVIKTTAEWSSEIETLSGRMGMTAEKASTLVSIMERFGVHSNVAAYSMAILSEEIKETSQAIDPFHTRLGRIFGSLRDTNGQIMDLSQVLDVARQKVSGASSEMEKLQVAQALVGTRMGGRFLEILKLNNEEWGKLQVSVRESGNVIDSATAKMGQDYNKALVEVQQAFRGVEMELGKAVLPTLTQAAESVASLVREFAKFEEAHPKIVKLAAAIGLFGSPIALVITAVALWRAGMKGLIDIFAQAGIRIDLLKQAVDNVNRSLERTAALQTGAAAATRTHTAAIEQQTVVAATSAASQRGQYWHPGMGYGGAAGVADAAKSAKLWGIATKALLAAAILPEAYALGKMVGDTFQEEIVGSIMRIKSWLPTWLGGISKETYQTYKAPATDAEREASKAEAAKRAEDEKKTAEEAAKAKADMEMDKLAKVASQRAKLMAEADKLGLASTEERAEAAEKELGILQKQQKLLEERLKQGLSETQRGQVENELLQNKIAKTQIIAKLAEDSYRKQELQLKATGAAGIENEIALLQTRLSDERTIGEERLKIEGEVLQKRKQLQEEVMRMARSMGMASADEEISYRKQRASEELGKGNVMAAAGELVKARELALKQFEQQTEFIKKIRFVSLQEEIDFEKQRLEAVKGNAEEEMKIIGRIADLDKQMYEQRLQYALNYTKGVSDEYQKMQKAQKSTGDEMTFEQARRTAELRQKEVFQQARISGRWGGTEEQREFATSTAQGAVKQYEQLEKIGAAIPEILRDFVDDAREILKRASGGEEVRQPTGPSPVVGSITSTIEGLSSSSLARSSEIPRLDTSFVDLATRIRDVLGFAMQNVQNFSNALADGARKIAGSNVQAGGGLGTPPGAGPQSMALATTGPSGPPQPLSFSSFGRDVREPIPPDVLRALVDNQDALRKVSDTLANLPGSLKETVLSGIALDEKTLSSLRVSAAGGKLELSIDPNSGAIMAQFVERAVVESLSK